MSHLELLLPFVPGGVAGNAAESGERLLLAIGVSGLVSLVLSDTLLDGPVRVIHYGT